MIWKRNLTRLLFCLPFLCSILYIQSFHGQWINNADVQWQYVQDRQGDIYLALDIYAPSGVKIETISSGGKDVTGSWELSNYPSWYKGGKSFSGLESFERFLHPYLPFNTDQTALYTNGRYTFLYKWLGPEGSTPVHKDTGIKYLNLGTQNIYLAEQRSGIKISSAISLLQDKKNVVDLHIFLPYRESFSPPSYQDLEIMTDNLAATATPFRFVVVNPQRGEYSIKVAEKISHSEDVLRGFYQMVAGGVKQVFTKLQPEDAGGDGRHINIKEIMKHFIAIVAMLYFVFIGWLAGYRFIKWRGLSFESAGEESVLAIFLGLIAMNYVFFLIGICKVLYWQLISVVLLATLFLLFDTRYLSYFKIAGCRQLEALKRAPWKIVFLGLLAALLLYHLAYCFLPAVYSDGVGDIVNSYLPLLNDYIISHSFEPAIQNSTYGILSQAFDVSRAVAMLLLGEPGVYLLSVVYIALFMAGVYLIGKNLFGIKNMLVYVAVLLLLSGDLFTERIHLGKIHAMILAVFMMALYSIRFSDDRKKYFFPALFFGFLTSQYVYFILTAALYYALLFVTAFWKYRTFKHHVFKIYSKGLLLCGLVSMVFHLKLFWEGRGVFASRQYPFLDQ